MKVSSRNQHSAPIVLFILVLACVVPEAILFGADNGWWGSGRWRSSAYANGGFWAGLLRGWQPNFEAQPYTMFVTYAFLHAGIGHLAVNMITLVSVGRSEVRRVGQLRFALLYVISALGGAVGFALLTTRIQPMVGASGALFGLVGAWIAWDVADAYRVRPGFRTLAYAVLWPVLLLVLLNIAMYWAAAGNLAWETHLGGTLAGLLMAPMIDRKKTEIAGDQ